MAGINNLHTAVLNQSSGNSGLNWQGLWIGAIAICLFQKFRQVAITNPTLELFIAET